MRQALSVLFGLFPGAAPATAQDLSQDWERCGNSSRAYATDQHIGDCTAIIRDGRETPGNMAAAFYNRGLIHNKRAS